MITSSVLYTVTFFGLNGTTPVTGDGGGDKLISRVQRSVMSGLAHLSFPPIRGFMVCPVIKIIVKRTLA